MKLTDVLEREETQTEDSKALRDDANFTHVAVWEYQGEGKRPLLQKSRCDLSTAEMVQRSYKNLSH